MTNPYDYKQPLSGSARYFARDSTLTQIASRVAADRPQSLALVGPRRAGKTSLINGLCDGSCWEGLVDQSQLTVAAFSLAQENPKNDREFLALIETRLGGDAGGVSNPKNQYERVTDLVRLATSGGGKLVLIFDDFEVITQNREISLDLFAYLRSLANNYEVALLIASLYVSRKEQIA